MRRQRRNWAGMLLALIFLLACTAECWASEYPVRVYQHLCSAAEDPQHYDSELLKSLKYLVEGEQGWVYRSNSDFLEDFGDQGTNYDQLRAFTSLLASHGSRLMVVYLPTRGLMNPETVPAGQFDYDRALTSYHNKLELLRSLGILVPDMERLLQNGLGNDFFFHRDIHWTPTGAKATADLVAEAIRAQKLLDPQPSFQVVNEPTGSYTIQGGMARGIRQLCGEQPIFEYVQGYGFSASFASEENALFADQPEAEAVLIGTSFSALERLNFNGFLQEALQAPVENFALGGGGDEGSWLNYAINGDFKQVPPKLIIWEVPGYYLLDDVGVYAQLIPAFKGGCGGQKPLIDTRVTLDRGNKGHQSLFFSKDLLDTPLSEVVFDLTFTDTEVHGINFKLWYSDGKVKRNRIINPKRAPTNGHFVFSLFDNLLEPNSGIMALELEKVDKQDIDTYLNANQAQSTDVQVKACTMPKEDPAYAASTAQPQASN